MTKIKITINSTILWANLNDSPAAQAFIKQLPLTSQLSEVKGYVEKVINLPHQLPTTEMANPEILHSGNLAYWQATDGSR